MCFQELRLVFVVFWKALVLSRESVGGKVQHYIYSIIFKLELEQFIIQPNLPRRQHRLCIEVTQRVVVGVYD